MRELIVQSAQQRLQRLALLAIGAAVITLGLSFLVSTLQRSQSTVMEQMTDRWSASFDILVRPKAVQELAGYLPPSHLVGSGGGITLDAWRQIQAMEGVEVAAPITQVGWVDFPVTIPTSVGPGLYRIEWEQSEHNGIQPHSAKGSTLVWITSVAMPAPLLEQAGVETVHAETVLPLRIGATMPVTLAAVDPTEEERLVGLSTAIKSGEYFGPVHNRPQHLARTEGLVYGLPILVANGDLNSLVMRFTAHRLPLPADPTESILQELISQGGPTHLTALQGTSSQSWESTPGRSGDVLLSGIGERVQRPWSAILNGPAAPIHYQAVPSVDSNQWLQAFQAIPSGVNRVHDATPTALFRNSEPGSEAHRITFDLVGVYDPSSVPLRVEDDPSFALYRPGGAVLVYDGTGSPTPESSRVTPLVDPRSYLITPAQAITTLDAVMELLPQAPIGAIRVRVRGVEAISEESITKVDQVAKLIAARTGLHVDIMRGAAPESVLVHLPSRDEVASAGYLAETWIHQGQAIEMFTELRRGDLLVMGLVMGVGVIFVLASSIVHVLLRQRELATLAAVGWRLRDLLLLVWAESAMVAASGGLVACLIFPRTQTLMAAVLALMLYLVGASLATLATGVARPMRLIRSSGVSANPSLAHVETLRQIAWASLRSRRRNLLSMAALVLPTSLLVVMTALSVRLEERFFVTVMGAQVALDVGPLHYAMMAAAFALAAATTTDLMTLSVLERRGELAVLSAIGWRRAALRSLVLWEGALWGLASGLTGIVVGLAALFLLYGRIQPGLWSVLPLVLAVPGITGLIGAVVPAESAGRMQPLEGVKTS